MNFTKRIFILIRVCAILLPFNSTVQGQLVLNYGDSYVFQFTTLPLAFTATGQNVFFYPEGGYFEMTGSSPSIAAFRLEMFENSVAELPLNSHDFFSSPNGAGIGAGMAWYDLQGAVRLTVTGGGPVTITSARAHVNIVDYRVLSLAGYIGNLAVVPEPSIFMLLVFALSVLILWRGRAVLHFHKKRHALQP